MSVLRPHRSARHARSWRLPGLVLLGFLLASPSYAPAAERRPVPERFVADEVLVKFTANAGFGARARAISAIGAEVVKSEPVLGYQKLRLPAGASMEQAIGFLAAEPAVEWVEPNGYYTVSACTTTPQDPALVDLPATPNQWGVYRTGLFSLWRWAGGGMPGIRIAIIDTGLDDFAAPHADLAANISSVGYDFVDDDAVPTDAGPFRGHGTHVAGIAGAVSNGTGTTGIAYCADLVIVRVMDCSSAGCPGTYEDIADGIRYAALNGARVINLSLGGASPSYAISAAVAYALSQHAIVVAAAGNGGLDGIGDPVLDYPAAIAEVVSVGASTSGDAVAGYSNYGPGLDVVAPGSDIHSTVVGGGTGVKSGTSMAAPFVAGIAALLASRNPAMGTLEFESWLEGHTTDIDPSKDGHGRVDFARLSDFSDIAPYPPAGHGNYFWEQLGADASFEAEVGDPRDADGRPNMGASSHDVDGCDDGVFPASFVHLPFMPSHIAPVATIDITQTVGDHAGPRYGGGPAKSLHTDAWFDWNSNTMFDPASEHEVIDLVEDPSTWGADTRTTTAAFAPRAEHILGNPLVVRTRLNYGASTGDPALPAPYGEVEDVKMINFVEDFDRPFHLIDPGVYMAMGMWGFSPDPSIAMHHGFGEFAVAAHPTIGIPCNGVIEGVSIMRTPSFDMREHSKATLRFWYCHNMGCAGPDACRIQIVKNGGAPIPIGPIPPGIGTVTLDISPHMAGSVVIEFVEETDRAGVLCIDDVTVWSYDEDRPKKVTDLAVSRAPGTARLDVRWTAMDENEHLISPPGEPLANIDQVRYAPVPILSEVDWRSATPVTSPDGVAVVPGLPGGITTMSFDVPSAVQPYYVAVRVQDEVNSISPVSNSPGEFTTAAYGATVVSLGDTTAAASDSAHVRFRVTNTGNTSDTFSLVTTNTGGWGSTHTPMLVTLAPLADVVTTVTVKVPPAAPDSSFSDVVLTATSLTDATASDFDTGRVTVLSGVATGVAGAGTIPRVASIRLAGPNPAAHGTSLEFALPRDGAIDVKVYDVTGALVRSVERGMRPAGVHRVNWDGRSDAGRDVAPGVYFLEASAAGLTSRDRVVIVR